MKLYKTNKMFNIFKKKITHSVPKREFDFNTVKFISSNNNEVKPVLVDTAKEFSTSFNHSQMIETTLYYELFTTERAAMNILIKYGQEDILMHMDVIKSTVGIPVNPLTCFTIYKLQIENVKYSLISYPFDSKKAYELAIVNHRKRVIGTELFKGYTPTEIKEYLGIK